MWFSVSPANDYSSFKITFTLKESVVSIKLMGESYYEQADYFW